MKTAHKTQQTERAETAHTALRILANEKRYTILQLLLSARQNGNDMCVHELSETVGISQSATSHYLAFLEAHGVVRSVRTGKTKCYMPTNSAVTKQIDRIINALR